MKIPQFNFTSEDGDVEVYEDLDSDDEVGKCYLTEGFEFHLSDDEDSKPPAANVIPKNSQQQLTVDKKIKEKRERSKEEMSSSEAEDEVSTVMLKVKEKKQQQKKKRKVEAEEDDKIETPTIEYGNVLRDADNTVEFEDFDLCRPIRMALTKMGWNKPTPIQSITIPVALEGKDICACAATGTGKTGAFMIPILERVFHKLYHPTPVTTVLVLTPTRELAVQIMEVTKSLAQFTKITCAISAGGLDRNSQEATLRLGPDIVIATLGRLIDHLQNAPNFNLDSIEILVLDEADRMLDEHFADQMKEVIKRCSRMRQTLLFSATMTEEVTDLALLSLKDPTKIFVNENREVGINLEQEFVKIREQHELNREVVIAALVKRTFCKRCIVFVPTKKDAHRLHIIIGLLGVNVGEFHGDLSQPQRLDALERFKEGSIDVILATDLLGRGIDIDNVDTVINMTMPTTIARYIHRVGRTARAGKRGRSVTLVNRRERKMMIEITKMSKIPVKHRVIGPGVLDKYSRDIKNLTNDIKEIQEEELEEKESRIAELKVNKAENLLKKKNDETSNRKRNWFQNHNEKVKEKTSFKGKTKGKRAKGT